MSYRENWHLIDFSKEILLPEKPRLEPKRSDLPCPALIGDIMEPVEHVDGRFYTSKSSFRAVTKAKGLTEVGNDAQRFRTPKKPDREKGIDQAIDRAIARAS